MQHVFKYFDFTRIRPIYEHLTGNYTRLTMDKYSSNLIELAI